MPESKTNVLLIEDNESHAVLVRRHIDGCEGHPFRLHWVRTLKEGVERGAAGDIDAVLLDLGLPDSEPDKTLDRFLSRLPDMPVVVLTTLDDMDMAIEAVKKGAQDHMVKATLTPPGLGRAINYAIERKRAQLQLEKYAEELERSNRDFQHFAHFAAHELKSPLWSVSLACGVLIEKHRDELDSESRELLDGLGQAVQQMNTLINDLLEFSRVESRGKPPEAVDCNEAVCDAIAVLAQKIEIARGKVTYGNLPTVRADPNQLRQVLVNLISNAIKYRHPDRNPEIRIEAERTDECWRFSVRDNGLGIPAQSVERIFGLFERAHDKNKYPGTGLGLAISQRIIERHGGRMWAESVEGEGSIFFFTLPEYQPS